MKPRISDKARMFINTLPIGQEFRSIEVAENINCEVNDFGSLMAVLRKKGHIKLVRKVVNPKGGTYAVYARLDSIPIFLGAGGVPIKPKSKGIKIDSTSPWYRFAYGATCLN